MTEEMKTAFNIFCESPKSVASTLVPKIRRINGTGKYIRFLDVAKIIKSTVRYVFKPYRFFDRKGETIIV